jgi:hypothetical protein
MSFGLPFAPAKLGDCGLAAQAIEQCGSSLRPRGASGLPAGLRTSVSDDAGVELDFCLIFAP